jgi:hypothetical protein
MWWSVQFMKLLIMQPPDTSSLLGPNILSTLAILTGQYRNELSLVPTASIIPLLPKFLTRFYTFHNFIHLGGWKFSVKMYEGVSKSVRTGRLERELQMVQLSVTRCSSVPILWVSLVSFAAITLCVASQWVFIVIVYFVINSVRRLLDKPLYRILKNMKVHQHNWCTCY